LKRKKKHEYTTHPFISRDFKRRVSAGAIGVYIMGVRFVCGLSALGLDSRIFEGFVVGVCAFYSIILMQCYCEFYASISGAGLLIFFSVNFGFDSSLNI
jgi:hypothetical protein